MLWFFGYVAIAAILFGVFTTIDPYDGEEMPDKDNRFMLYAIFSILWVITLLVLVGVRIAQPFVKK